MQNEFSKIIIIPLLDEDFSYDKKGLRLGIFKSQVDKAIIEQIREVNAERPKTMISDDIPIPTSLMGLSAKPKHISPSRAGYINFYYEYGDLKWKTKCVT